MKKQFLLPILALGLITCMNSISCNSSSGKDEKPIYDTTRTWVDFVTPKDDSNWKILKIPFDQEVKTKAWRVIKNHTDTTYYIQVNVPIKDSIPKDTVINGTKVQIKKLRDTTVIAYPALEPKYILNDYNKNPNGL